LRWNEFSAAEKAIVIEMFLTLRIVINGAAERLARERARRNVTEAL